MSAVAVPDLTGRVARCACGAEVPSKRDLPFFDFRGEGSDYAERGCANCGFYDVAHGVNASGRVCDVFEPRGDTGVDTFYCGHGGWD